MVVEAVLELTLVPHQVIMAEPVELAVEELVVVLHCHNVM